MLWGSKSQLQEIDLKTRHQRKKKMAFALFSIISVLILGSVVTQAPPDGPRTIFTNFTAGHFSFPNCSSELLNNGVCDRSKSYVERARALINEFTLEELVNNTVNSAPGVPRLGIPAYEWWNEALHGVGHSPGVNYAPDGNFSSSTSFPQPILLGATFDDRLINSIASAVSTEARAFNNFGHAGLNYWTPNINPFKDPRWGRGQETPGEDPFHLSRYTFHLITGLQGGVDPDPLKVIATCKHYVGYDLELWRDISRLEFDAVISNQDLVEYYILPFQTCIRDAKAASAMCSYNSVNGVPACANKFILQDILRDLWGFESRHGFVTSDCAAVWAISHTHNYTEDDVRGSALALSAGCDLSCESTYQVYLVDALKQNLVSRDEIEQALVRQYINLIRLGYFDDAESQPYRQLSWSDVNTPENQELAYNAAVEGITLLKNDGTLPLSKSIKKLALIGPWANASIQMLGNYYGNPPYVISPLQAASDAGYLIEYAIGTAINTASTTDFSRALDIARNADALLYIGGIDNTIEREGWDRDCISWPGNQLELVSQLADLDKPLIVLQMGGGQVDDTALKANPKVNAVLWGGYPGQSGGRALIDIITGVKAPAGRLSVTQYPADYTDQVPMTDMSLRPGSNNPGRTYKWYTGTPVYEFGYGLHYTTFEGQWHGANCTDATFNIQELLSSRLPSVDHADLIELASFIVDIKNTGNVTSDYTALLFASTADAGSPPYAKKGLVSYSRIHDLQRGNVATVQLPIRLGEISRVDSDGNRILYPGTYKLSLDVDERLTTLFTLTGDAAQLSLWPSSSDLSFKDQLDEQHVFDSEEVL